MKPDFGFCVVKIRYFVDRLLLAYNSYFTLLSNPEGHPRFKFTF